MGLVRCDVQNFISCPLFVQLVMEEKMSSSLIKPEKINMYVDVQHVFYVMFDCWRGDTL